MAEAVFQQMVNEANLTEQIKVDSAGTGSWHVGEPAHPGTLQVLRKHGIHYDGRARQVRPHDLTASNTYVIAMDQSNLDHLHRLNRSHPQMHRLLDFANRETGEAFAYNVPDPYYTGNFDTVYQMVAESCAHLLATIQQQEGMGKGRMKAEL